MTLRGTTYVYQGDELGMVNNQVNHIEEFDDVEIRSTYQDWKNKGKDLDKFISISNEKGRDNARTPMQWDASPNGGFSSVKPWLASNQKYKLINVALQEKDSTSILNYYRKLIQYRKDHLSLVYGTFEVIQEDHETLFAYWRRDDENLLIVHNLSDNENTLFIDAPAPLRIEISNYQDSPEGCMERLPLRPWESIIYKAF
jgi:glycosidase